MLFKTACRGLILSLIAFARAFAILSRTQFGLSRALKIESKFHFRGAFAVFRVDLAVSSGSRGRLELVACWDVHIRLSRMASSRSFRQFSLVFP